MVRKRYIPKEKRIESKVVENYPKIFYDISITQIVDFCTANGAEKFRYCNNDHARDSRCYDNGCDRGNASIRSIRMNKSI